MKTKRLTKFGAVLSAALVLLSGILSVSAASVPQAVIDTDRKASVSLYKYDFTSAHAAEVCPVPSVSGIEVPFWRIKASSAFFVWLSAVFR